MAGQPGSGPRQQHAHVCTRSGWPVQPRGWVCRHPMAPRPRALLGSPSHSPSAPCQPGGTPRPGGLQAASRRAAPAPPPQGARGSRPTRSRGRRPERCTGCGQGWTCGTPVQRGAPKAHGGRPSPLPHAHPMGAPGAGPVAGMRPAPGPGPWEGLQEAGLGLGGKEAKPGAWVPGSWGVGAPGTERRGEPGWGTVTAPLAAGTSLGLWDRQCLWIAAESSQGNERNGRNSALALWPGSPPPENPHPRPVAPHFPLLRAAWLPPQA